MKINLFGLSNIQKELDEEIHRNHNFSYQLSSEHKNLALFVELGELANEVRSFKYWSNKNRSDDSIILEEYADGLHFILSKCLEYNIEPIFDIDESKKMSNKLEITRLFNDLYKNFSYLENKNTILKWFRQYIELGYALGFNIDQIKNAYLLKNKKNHKRQLENY